MYLLNYLLVTEVGTLVLHLWSATSSTAKRLAGVASWLSMPSVPITMGSTIVLCSGYSYARKRAMPTNVTHLLQLSFSCDITAEEPVVGVASSFEPCQQQQVWMRRYERKSVEVGVFRRGWVTLNADFRVKGTSPTNHSWYQSSRVIALLCGIKISAVPLLVLSQCTHVTDGQTDGRTERRTELRLPRLPSHMLAR